MAELREHMEYCSSTSINFLPPLPQCLWPPNLARWWLTVRHSYPKSHTNIWPCDLPGAIDKQKPSYLHYHSACDHQCWQYGDLKPGDRLKALYLHYHTAYGHETCRVVNFHEELLPIKSHAFWVTNLARSRDKLKILYLRYHRAYGHQTRQGIDLLWRTPTIQTNWKYNHVVLRNHVTN